MPEFESAFESFVGVNPWTALFTFCNMIVTFLVLRHFLFQPVKKMIDDRQAEIDAMYAQADAARQQAAELEQQYQARLEDVKQESDALLRQAADRARAREAEIVAEAKQQARTLRESAEAQIAQEKKKAVNELKGEIGGIAMEIASQVVEREVREQDHQALIDEFIAHVGDASLPPRQRATAPACLSWRPRSAWTNAFCRSWTVPPAALRRSRLMSGCCPPPTFPGGSVAPCWTRRSAGRCTPTPSAF